MRLIRDVRHCPKDWRGAVIALGNFEGVHLGHQALLREVVSLAEKRGVPSAAMTFEPHPREFFNQYKERLRLASFRGKVEAIAACGVNVLYAPRFNAAFAAMPAERFITELLHENLQAVHVITGDNFRFGKGRLGNSLILAGEAARLGFSYSAHPPICMKDGRIISSSAIREALRAGDVALAAQLLGRPYAIAGHVRKGFQRGRLLGFPTLNLALDDIALPRFGVYAARARLNGQGEWLDAVANLGIKPTFGAHAPLLETHCFDGLSEHYGERAEIQLLHFLREERRFSGIEGLQAQIAEDSMQAKQWLRQQPHSL